MPVSDGKAKGKALQHFKVGPVFKSDAKKILSKQIFFR